MTLAQINPAHNEDNQMKNPQADAAGFWLKLSLHCPLVLIEPVTDLMGILSGSGVEQSPENQDGCTVSGYFEIKTGGTGEDQQITTSVKQQMAEVFTLYGLKPGEIWTERIENQDWATSWKQFFKTFEIVPGLVIKPSWEEFQPTADQQVIEMDPGMAFGTGQHASTALALDLMTRSCKQHPPHSVLDIGTGTGILAMASILFGGQQVLAIDNDPLAVKAAGDNVAANGLSAQIAVNAAPLETVTGSYQLIAANIVHDVLIAMALDIQRLGSTGGHVVLAGILRGEQEESIEQHYSRLGFTPLERCHREEWAALLLQHG